MAGLRSLFMACLMMLAPNVQAFIDPPVVVPTSPTTATPITIEIRNGLCDALLDFSITSPLNPVDVVINRIPTQMDPFCINPVHTDQVPIGTLPAGQHQVRLYFRVVSPPGQQPYLWQELSVTVASAGSPEPAPVPAVSGWLTICIMVTLVGFVAWRRWFTNMFNVVAGAVLATWAALTPSPVLAVTHIEVLLSADSAAATPEEVINWGFSSPPGVPPPLPALAAEPFLAIDYFIAERFRAQGDFKAILDAHPDSPQALLERFIVVTYTDGANIGNALDAY